MKKIILLTVIILMGCSEGTVTVTFSDKFFEKRLMEYLDTANFPYEIKAEGQIEFQSKNKNKFHEIKASLMHIMREEVVISYGDEDFHLEILKLLDRDGLDYDVEVKHGTSWIRLPPSSSVHIARLEKEVRGY